nr:hypothetical protein [Bacteroidota bacterium]
MESSENQISALIGVQRILPGEYTISDETEDLKTVSAETFTVNTIWNEVSPCMEAGMSFSVNFVVNSKIYVCTGRTSGYSLKNRMFAYDPLGDQWTEKARFPEEDFSSVTGFSIDDKGYVMIDEDDKFSPNGSSNHLYEYDPATDKWTQKNSFPGGNRYGSFGVAFDGKGYIGLGVNKTDFWSYNPTTDNWEQMPDFPGHRRAGQGTIILNDELFIIGGTDNSPFESDTWNFNFDTKQWGFVCYVDLSLKATYVVNNSCYILNGETNHNTNTSEYYLYAYDPYNNKIIKDLGVFPGGIRSRAGINISFDSKLYFGLGKSFGNSEYLNDVWQYPLMDMK